MQQLSSILQETGMKFVTRGTSSGCYLTSPPSRLRFKRLTSKGLTAAHPEVALESQPGEKKSENVEKSWQILNSPKCGR
jgi:hypothetical protein